MNEEKHNSKTYGDIVRKERIRFIRYPGGKQRILQYILPLLPTRDEIRGFYVEPFVGGASVFFAVAPKKAVLSDINKELIELYRGIRYRPKLVWQLYANFPSSKKGYYKIRGMDLSKAGLEFRAARTLFLNRTCFKGMWRHNDKGQFNIGYGGQDKRWVVTKDGLQEVSRRLRRVRLQFSDFEPILEECSPRDFVFLDPPYSPGKSKSKNMHYAYSQFCREDYIRLANCLRRATRRNVKWAMTISAHRGLLTLFRGNRITRFSRGTGNRLGLLVNDPGEALVRNYR